MYQAVLNAVFPPRCVLCGRLIEPQNDQGLCRLCRWQDYQNPQPLEEGQRGRCSLVYEDQLQRAIHRMKYKGCRSYGLYFARWMAKEGAAWAAEMDFDRMTAVPLAKGRMKSRGYNQAEVMARELSRLCRVPYEPLLRRKRETRPQRGLAREQRGLNLAGAFEVQGGREEPRRICVVDDIYTTGSTVRSCMRALRERWPEAEIWFWVLARRKSEKDGFSAKNL